MTGLPLPSLFISLIMDNRSTPWQVSLRSVFVVIAIVAVGIGLTTRVGFTVLASVPIGLAYGFVAGGIVGSLSRTRKQSIQGGVVGAFVTHFAVLLDSAVSAFAATGPWSLQSFMVLAPVGAICGALLAIRPSLGIVKSEALRNGASSK